MGHPFAAAGVEGVAMARTAVRGRDGPPPEAGAPPAAMGLRHGGRGRDSGGDRPRRGAINWVLSVGAGGFAQPRHATCGPSVCAVGRDVALATDDAFVTVRR